MLAAQKRYEAERQRPFQESSLADPTLSAGYVSNGGPLPGQGSELNLTRDLGFWDWATRPGDFHRSNTMPHIAVMLAVQHDELLPRRSAL